MADPFYPFVENPSTTPPFEEDSFQTQIRNGAQNSNNPASSDTFLAAEKPMPSPQDSQPMSDSETLKAKASLSLEVSSAARIAVYDDVAAAPRVVMVAPQDIRSYLEEITATVSKLAQEQGGSIPFTVIRECVENLIHAYFKAPTISILDKGNTIRFSDQGPGIPNKRLALEYGTSSATESMKRYIRGVGSGLPYASQYMADKGGSLTIEDNISGGCIVTISLSQAQALEGADSPLAKGEVAGVSRQGQELPAQGASLGYGQPFGAYPYGQPAVPIYGTTPAPTAQPYWGQSASGWGQPAPSQAPYGQPQTPGYGVPAYGAQPPQGYPAPQHNPSSPYGQAPSTNPSMGPGYGTNPSSQAFLGDTSVSERDRNALMFLLQNHEGGGAELTATFGSSGPTWSRTLKHLSELGFVQKHGQKYRLTEVGRQWTLSHWL